MVRLERLGKRYPEFDMEIDLEVDAGELVSILGPSGSGKTTTLRLIAGFEHPDRGRVLVDERDVTALGPAERRFGYVFQDYTLFPHMNVSANIGYGLRVRRRSAGEIDRRVDELLELMDLSGFGRRTVETLSGGERQRVAIARALAVDPVLLMLDEPFSSIDEVLRGDLRREIVRLQKELGITVLFVTHSRREALSISDRVAILRDGRLVQYGDPLDLYHDPVDEFVAGFVGEIAYVDVDGRRLGLRPEDVALADGEGRPVAGGPDAFDGREAVAVPGTVRGREFLGFAWLYELETDAGTLFSYDVRRIDEGARVTARLRVDGR